LEADAQLKSVIDEINYGVSLVVVEGKHDVEGLRRVGLKSPIQEFSSACMPIFAFVEEVVKDYKGLTVLVLLDYDDEGREMANRLSQELEEKGVKVDRFLRKKVGEILWREGINMLEDVFLIRSRATV
jgi:5S rRNA maturation endonuclease (ribonuclease M5)